MTGNEYMAPDFAKPTAVIKPTPELPLKVDIFFHF